MKIKRKKANKMKTIKDLHAKKEIPLLCQEMVRGIDVPTKNRKLRMRYARKIAVMIALIVVIFGMTAILLAAYFSDDFYLLLINAWSDNVGDMESDTEESYEREPESETDSKETAPSETESEPIEGEPSEEVPTLEMLYAFDYSLVPDGELAVIPMDLSFFENGAGYINNSTGYSINSEMLLKKKLTTDIGLEMLTAVTEPTVLIIHTHGTEGYLEDGAISYTNDGNDVARTSDKTKGVVYLGELMAKILNERGIPTIHVGFMHDSVGYRNSYERAKETINDYLTAYPSIKLVIDVHRDAVMRSTGELVRPVTLVDGEVAAQVTCVVGSDWGGGECPNWQDNLSIALKLRESLNGKYVNLCRPTDLRPTSYNQELSKFAMLLEIGSAGNSIEEAERSAKIIAEHLAKIIENI